MDYLRIGISFAVATIAVTWVPLQGLQTHSKTEHQGAVGYTPHQLKYEDGVAKTIQLPSEFVLDRMKSREGDHYLFRCGADQTIYVAIAVATKIPADPTNHWMKAVDDLTASIKHGNYRHYRAGAYEVAYETEGARLGPTRKTVGYALLKSRSAILRVCSIRSVSTALPDALLLHLEKICNLFTNQNN